MKKRAFTLVELLVVIGIIALLVGILLPALSAARRQAGAVKCAAALREIGNATLMYVQDNRGFAPPAKLIPGVGLSGSRYNIDGVDYVAATPPYWMNFIAKYVTKTKVGYATNKNGDAVQARQSIFWACPAWPGYSISSGTNPGDIAVTQTGYGWNAFPEYTQSFPAKDENLNDNDAYKNSIAVLDYSATPTVGTWYKFNRYTHPSERAVAADALFWLLQTEKPLDTNGTLYGCKILTNANPVTQTGCTTADWYRHGKYGSPTPDGFFFNATSGKTAYNILYADGHVAGTNDRATIWKVQRMRYPG